MAGYSLASLVNKLGYKPGDSVSLYGAPNWFVRELKANQIIISKDASATWAHAFFTNAVQLSDYLDTIDFNSASNGLWVSWPKKASKVKTDLTEQTFRDFILPLGWVDTKVCAIDESWSGLKFLRRNTQLGKGKSLANSVIS